MNNHRRPFWISEALAAEPSGPARPLEGTVRTDLAIVGAGYTGLWTAILAKQAQPDLDIVIIEADVSGGGASGRNGGCVLSWSTKLASLIRLYGETEGTRLAVASEQAILDIDRFVQEHRIDCDWRLHGTLYTATSAAQMGASDSVRAALEARGLSQWSRLPIDEVRRRAGSRAHLEGWYSPLAATVQPGLLVRGLRRVALSLGVRLYEGTPLGELTSGQPLTLHTPRGRVIADRAVIAVNAWMGELFPAFRRSIVIVSSDMVITEPDPSALARMSSSLRTKLLSGYAGALMLALRRMLPEFSHTPMAASWNGPSDRSATGLPFFGTLPGHSNVWYGLGYSGNGVGPTRMGGAVLSSLALGLDNEWTRSPLTHGPLGAFPPEPIRYTGSILVRNAIRRQEKAEDHNRPVAPWDRWLAGFAASAGKADKASKA